MTRNKDDTLLFVYNADSTLFASLSDFARKVVAPKTYGCNLCMITYGLFEMKDEWKEFLDTLPQHKTFLHRDEFVKKYPGYAKVQLPAIFVISNGAVKELVSAQEINHKKSVAELKAFLLLKLRKN